jgi:glycosyltransferase involved in cell wall biosynthesis
MPAPPEGYGGLEAIAAWVAMEAAKRGHQVFLITTKGSAWEGNWNLEEAGVPKGTLSVLSTIPPNWYGNSERQHYLTYRTFLEKEFGEGQGVVWENDWFHYGYLSAKSFPKMKMISTHHGMIGFRTPPPVLLPRMVGLSKPHSHLISQTLNIPCRYVWNGIPMPDIKDYTQGNYLLSLNRITDEKGIHDCIDVAMQAKTPIVIAGDDTHVVSQQYVHQIIQRCRTSGALASYLGLVDMNTRNELLKNCKAVIGCPKPTWMEGFGLYAVEAMAYGKPVLALANGGLTDIIQQGKTGFMSAGTYSTPNDLVQYVDRLGDIKPEDCRVRVEQEFSAQRMTDRYLEMFEGVMNDDPAYQW